jgi:dGTPase
MSDSTSNLIYSEAANGFLAPYACIPEKTRGRLLNEKEGKGRSCYQRDRDRVIHSTAFRRLEYKTQVFVYHEGDHFRTRLTHSLEVAQLARSIARELRLDEDLSEAISISHDLGHTPFGHAGEDALNEAMVDFGGFDHNAQTVRVLTKLENKYGDFDGLNLTWECLEGIAKHGGPVTGDMPRALSDYADEHDLQLSSYASLESQVSGLCDDIAYNNHDIEDGLRAELFTLDDIIKLPLVGDVLREVKSLFPGAEDDVLVHESKRRMIGIMVHDLVETTKANIVEAGIETVDDVRNLGRPLVRFSPRIHENRQHISAFLMENMYRHYKVNRMTSKSKRVVKDLFNFFNNEPNCLPTSWRNAVTNVDDIVRAEIVGDYIAGMTDKFALEEYQRIFDTSHKLFGAG